MEAPAVTSLFGFWSQADAIGKATVALLLLMSIATWYLLLVKSLQLWRVRRRSSAVMRAFWSAANLEQGARQAGVAGGDHPFSLLAAELAAALHARASEATGLSASLDRGAYAESILRAGLQRASRRLDAGLGVLASVGATAPFVGLFGTVWGIYHALVAIGFSGQASLDQVAGPVGEALIMTALGIAVAVPAVLSYNVLVRANRDFARELDGFAQDLHACVLKSSRTAPEVVVSPGTAPAASRRGGA